MAGTRAGYPAGNLRVARRVPAHGPRAGPADKITRVPRGNPVRDPDRRQHGTRVGPVFVCWLGCHPTALFFFYFSSTDGATFY